MIELESCPGHPKLDPRVRRTRRLLEDAVRSLLREKQYSEISVADIAERATVNRATFYAHFEDKRHLVNSMITDDLHRAVIARLSHGTPFGHDSLCEVAAGVFEFIASTQMQCPRAGEEFNGAVANALQEALQGFLRNWMDHDERAMRFFPGAGLDTVSTMIAWSLYGAAMNWTHLTRRPPAEQAAREIVNLLLR